MKKKRSASHLSYSTKIDLRDDKNFVSYKEKMRPARRSADEPRKKKEHGQNFLRDQGVVDAILENALIVPSTTVMEIGCGDGFLTKSILQQTPCKELQVFEIDEEWLNVVKKNVIDPRLKLNLINILDVSLENFFSAENPVVLLANLPYHITFPILHKIQRQAHLFSHGVVMVQEEVAQRLVAQTGRDAGAVSHFFQHYFELTLLNKVPPSAFEPQPKIFSRLVGFKPKANLATIPDIENFWLFMRQCFKFPRQMLRNNLKGSKFYTPEIPERLLNLRAQQIRTEEFVELWVNVVKDQQT
jgi:16S rRNA (adenine1518-N6/adenine1519-N6)-dimethyltransferase